MPIRFECDHCHKTMQAPDGTEGKKARCPACNGISRIPGAAAAPKPKTFESDPAEASFSGAPAFGAGSETFESDNPYQSPVAVPGESKFGSRPRHRQSGQVQPEWERQPSFGSFFRTTWQVLTKPSGTFRNLPREAELTRPLTFSAASGAMIGLIVAGLMAFLFAIIALAASANPGGGAGGAEIGMLMGIAAAALIGAPLMYGVMAPLGCFIGGGVLHLMLMLVGANKYSYTATVRFTGYAYFASWPFVPFTMIPLIGILFALASMVWVPIVYIVGLAEFQETTRGKAALAVLLPFGFFMVLGVGFAILGAMLDAAG